MELAVGNRRTIDVVLQEDATALGEVVINAGYYNTTEKTKTGSIARITAKEIEAQPVSNVLATLQGRLAGVNVIQNTGIPGGGFDIKIRGTNSIRTDANAPLYIVDGIPFNAQSLGYNQTSQSILAGVSSPLTLLNPDIIQSIEILKDADATAIYGSRGANGVVLITTKEGGKGSMKIRLNTYTGLSQYSRPMKLLNTQQFQDVRLEAFANDGISDYPFNAYDLNGTWDANRYTDWQKELLGNTGRLEQTSISLSGGSEQTKYLMTGLWHGETTVFPGSTGYDKIGVSISGSHHSSDQRFQMRFGAHYNIEKSSLLSQDLTMQALTLAPNAPELYDSQGQLNWQNGTFNNPLAYLEGTYTSKNGSLMTNAHIKYKLNSNWSAIMNLGYNEYQIDESKASPHTLYNPMYGLTSASSNLIINWGERSSWLLEPQINGEFTLGNLKMKALVGGTVNYESMFQNSMIGVGFANNFLINNIQAANTILITNQILSEYRYSALYGRLNLNLNDTYLINITGRRDGSSRFGPGNRFANFGAIGIAWIVSNEPFLRDHKSLSFAKLRFSYGSSGSDQIGDYQYLDTYHTTNNNYGGILGVEPTGLANLNFGWEINRKLEYAIETTWFNDRLSINASYFRNKTNNQLVGTPLPATTGFGLIQENWAAEVENTGVELELAFQPFHKNDFKWNIQGNISWIKNKLLSFDGLDNSVYSNTLEIGESINILKLYHNLGVNTETGVYDFVDIDGDGSISGFGDRTFIANLDPKYFGGLLNQFKYKNWEFDMQWQFVKQKGLNYRFNQVTPGTLSNIPSYYLSSTWNANTQENTTHQMFTTGANQEALIGHALQTVSSSTISDASYARLKNIQLAYSLPQIKGIHVKIYLQGQNLFTITDYKGLDPETRSSTILPPLRQWVVGTQIQF